MTSSSGFSRTRGIALSIFELIAAIPLRTSYRANVGFPTCRAPSGTKGFRLNLSPFDSHSNRASTRPGTANYDSCSEPNYHNSIERFAMPFLMFKKNESMMMFIAMIFPVAFIQVKRLSTGYRNAGHLNMVMAQFRTFLTVSEPDVLKNPFPGIAQECCKMPAFGNIDSQSPQLNSPSLPIAVFGTARKAVTPEQHNLSAESEPLRSLDATCMPMHEVFSRGQGPRRIMPDPGSLAETIVHKLGLKGKSRKTAQSL